MKIQVSLDISEVVEKEIMEKLNIRYYKPKFGLKGPHPTRKFLRIPQNPKPILSNPFLNRLCP